MLVLNILSDPKCLFSSNFNSYVENNEQKNMERSWLCSYQKLNVVIWTVAVAGWVLSERWFLEMINSQLSSLLPRQDWDCTRQTNARQTNARQFLWRKNLNRLNAQNYPSSQQSIVKTLSCQVISNLQLGSLDWSHLQILFKSFLEYKIPISTWHFSSCM